MRDDTKSKLLFWAVIAIMVFLMALLCSAICEDLKAGYSDSVFHDFINQACRDIAEYGVVIAEKQLTETLINEYPVWVVSASGDSTFQTVQVLKCRQIFPNGQVEFLGYRVVVDSSGTRIHEEESVWFLNWAVRDALSLRVELSKQSEIPAQRGKGD